MTLGIPMGPQVGLDHQPSEAEFQAQVIELARLLGYKVAHFRAAKTSKGWRTPVAADGVGWPDLALVGHGRIVFAELKSKRGKLRPEQADWLEHLRANGQQAYVWRPDSFGEIVDVLRGEKDGQGTAEAANLQT